MRSRALSAVARRLQMCSAENLDLNLIIIRGILYQDFLINLFFSSIMTKYSLLELEFDSNQHNYLLNLLNRIS